jgi:hypothetical protein
MKGYLLFGLVVIAVLFLGCTGTAPPTMFSQVIINETTKISAQSYKAWDLSPITRPDCTLTGSISSDETVNLYIVDEVNYVKYYNGNPFEYLYGLKSIKQSMVNANYPMLAGKAYLVIDNKFSILTPKNVQITITETCGGS